MGNFSIADLEYIFWTGLRNGSIGTIGAKGDPGGLNSGTDLGVSDLNTITTPGLYRQANTTNSTLVNNYPVAGGEGAGTLMVIQQGGSPSAGIEQIWYGNWTLAGGRVFYIRNYFNASTWTPWRAFNSTRVDQTAGRAIYQWDNLNNREQLTYGDTGWRDITSLWTDTTGTLAAFSSGIAQVRRIGNQVMWAFDKNTIAYTPYLLNIPAGFKPASGVEVLSGDTWDNPTKPWTLFYNGTTNWFPSSGPMAPSVMYRMVGNSITTTADAWPTSLPGTAIGVVPNI